MLENVICGKYYFLKNDFPKIILREKTFYVEINGAVF
jgi:hypothetical protein